MTYVRPTTQPTTKKKQKVGRCSTTNNIIYGQRHIPKYCRFSICLFFRMEEFAQ